MIFQPRKCTSALPSTSRAVDGDALELPARMKGIGQIGGQLKTKIEDLKEELRPEELIVQAGAKAWVAERKENKRREADELFEAADHLRFQLLLDEGRELTQATVELQRVLKPFFVLENPDWTKLGHMMALLDDDRRVRIVNDVNELLFLWMATIDESAGDSVQLNAKSGPVDEDLLAPALAICGKALVWVEPKGPWRALEARLRASRTLAAGSKGKEDDRGRSTRFNEPREVNGVDSPLSCFQWGVLAYRAGRLSRAIEWLERASRLERGKNYWHQFLLGYLEDKAGQTDDAFRNYSIACSLRSESPWVLFSRARIYRVLGKWDWAREDIGIALEKLNGRPEATKVRLELAYLYQQVGDFLRGAEGVRPCDRGRRRGHLRAGRSIEPCEHGRRVGGRRKGAKRVRRVDRGGSDRHGRPQEPRCWS